MRRSIALLLLLVPAALGAQATDEREAVRAAVLDYIEGFYEGDSTRFVRSVRPEVFKYGFARRPGGTYEGMQMTWQGFHDFANRVKAGRVRTPASAPKIVELLDVADQTAAAKVVAWWGIDYVLLGKHEGRWMIYHVMWQSPPPAPTTR